MGRKETETRKNRLNGQYQAVQNMYSLSPGGMEGR